MWCVWGEGGEDAEERRVAELLGVDRHTVAKWVKEGWIRAVRLPSGRYRIPESEVKKILEGGSNRNQSI
ncbi:MAG: MerR family transcriptional regulator [Candidatus Freyarchaeota archaeon]